MGKFRQAVRVVVLSVLAASSIFANSLANAAWQAPLSSTEENRAIGLAIGDSPSTNTNTAKTETQPALTARSLGTAGGVTADTDHGTTSDDDSLGREVLLVELKRQKKSATGQAPRIAEVFVFDYSTLKAELHRIDVESDQLIETLPLNSIHLPLNDRELATAKLLLSDHTPAIQALAAEYQSSFNRTLDAQTDIEMKLSIWKPAAHQVTANPLAKTCMSERCALVSVFTTDRYSFSVEPVVNLVRGSVHLGAIQ